MDKSNNVLAIRVRLLTAVVAIVLLMAALVPMAAHAQTQLTHGFLRYEVEDNSVVIIDYAGNEEEVWVPAYIAGKPVNHIAMGAFCDSWTVKKIYLPDTVTTTDEGAFAEDQEVIFDWNVGRGNDEEEQSEQNGTGEENQTSGDKDDAGDAAESNTPANRGTSVTAPGASGGVTAATRTPSTGDHVVGILPVVLVGAAAAVCGVVVRRQSA
ncbi:MAG: hypothetical protein IKG22_00100 [Atopobiaceae bacterium]|nr:hypothetical protein [Atopobiaceae bacterium]